MSGVGMLASSGVEVHSVEDVHVGPVASAEEDEDGHSEAVGDNKTAGMFEYGVLSAAHHSLIDCRIRYLCYERSNSTHTDLVLGVAAVAVAAVVAAVVAATAAAAEGVSRRQALTRARLSWPPGRPRS